MPDVEFRFAPEMYDPDNRRYGRAGHPMTRELTLEVLAKNVAQQMDCLDEVGNVITHDWQTQIAIPVFEPFTGMSDRLVLIRIEGYDWPDRMRNIAERCEHVGTRMKSAWGLRAGQLAVTFNPLPRGSSPDEACWVSI